LFLYQDGETALDKATRVGMGDKFRSILEVRKGGAWERGKEGASPQGRCLLSPRPSLPFVASCHRLFLSLPPSLSPPPFLPPPRQAFAYNATHNMNFGTFVGTFLCAARQSRDPPAAGAAAAGGAAAAACVLQKLDAHGVHHAIKFKRLVAAYAGVQMGPEAIRHKATLSAP